MNTNNISRFLVESARYLDLDPEQAFRMPDTEETPDNDSTAADNDSDYSDCCQLLRCA